jgi:hypothetical protein
LLGYESDEDGENFPVRLPGIDKLLSTRSIRHYYTKELIHYLDFYWDVKRFGLPFNTFLECPYWVLQLQRKFDGIYQEIENFLMRHNRTDNTPIPRSKQYRRIRRR